MVAKKLRSFEFSVLVNNNLCGKLALSMKSSTTFDESFEVTAVTFFIPDFNSLSCELDNSTYYIESFYTNTILEQNKIVKHIHNILTVPCEKTKTFFYLFLLLQ